MLYNKGWKLFWKPQSGEWPHWPQFGAMSIDPFLKHIYDLTLLFSAPCILPCLFVQMSVRLFSFSFSDASFKSLFFLTFPPSFFCVPFHTFSLLKLREQILKLLHLNLSYLLIGRSQFQIWIGISQLHFLISTSKIRLEVLIYHFILIMCSWAFVHN